MNSIDPTRLRERMTELGITQASLARGAGVAQPTIAKLLSGESKNSAHLHKIARGLETSPSYLTGETDDPDIGALPRPTSETISEQLDAVQITEIDLKFGMGGGAYLDSPIEANQIVFSRSWIANFTNAPPEKLFFARGMGDSMAPTIHDGDIVLIDASQKSIEMWDQIWAISYYEAGMIKRLRPSATGYEIMSDNQNVSTATANDGELSVIGRVIAIVRRV